MDSISDESGASPDLRRSRRKRRPAIDPDKFDRLPPHSIEAEQGVLGCILWKPVESLIECAKKIRGSESQFYDLRHKTIYDTACAMFHEREAIDLITLQQRLKDRKMLDQIGGITYLSSLQDAVPSAANLSFYLDILCEKTVLRRMIRTCSDIVARAYESEAEVDELIDGAELEVVRVSKSRASTVASDDEWTINELFDYDVANDGRCVLGFRDGKALRWLCEGQSCWFVGQSGIGKSSLLLQMAVLWCLGKDFCGVGPGRKLLRILYVQAENDKGDASEQVQGVIKSLIDAFEFKKSELAGLSDRLKVVRCRARVGVPFFTWLETETIKHGAHVTMFDPLLSFAGIDLSRQDQCSQLFTVVDRMLERTKVVLIGAHHTNKPQEKKKTEGYTTYDFSYAGAGSSVLTNWARAICILSPLGDDKFQLMFTKRGNRTGAHHIGGEPTNVLYLSHGQGRINWQQIDPPVEPEPVERKGKGRPSKVEEVMALGLGPVIDKLTTAVGLNELARRIIAFAAERGPVIKRTAAHSIVENLVKNGVVKLQNGDYIKA